MPQSPEERRERARQSAHIDEDNLYADVLAQIAAGTPDAKALALEALATRKLAFARWHA